MDEKRVSEILDYVRAHYNDPVIVQTRLAQCNQAIEWAEHLQRWNWVIEFARALSYHFVYSRPISMDLEMQGTEQAPEVMKDFWEQGKALMEQGLLAAKQVRDQDAESEFLGVLARLASYLDDFEMAVNCLNQKAHLASHDVKLYVARELHMLGNQAGNRGNLLAARSCYQASLDILQELDNRYAMAEELSFMGLNELKQNNLDIARQLFAKGIKIGSQLKDDLRVPVVNCLWGLGDTLVLGGEIEQAKSIYREALSIANKISVPGIDSIREHIRDALAKLSS